MKTTKRLMSILLSLVMLLTITAGLDFSSYAATSGDYEYTVLSDGTAEITRYKGSDSNITIPSKLNGYKVTIIGLWAFYECVSLLSVTIPNSVTSIDGAAFAWCYNLTNIIIGSGVTSIDINGGAFSACTSLTNITVDSNNKKYSSQDGVLFNKNKTKLMLYPCGNKRTSYTIPNSVTSIGDRAFFDCGILTSITIPNSVTSIGYTAFERCTKLKIVTIPNSIISIDDNAFCNCDSLTNINVDSNNKNYLSQDGVLFNKNKTTLIQYPIGNTRTSYTIPNTVTKIGIEAFSGCKKFKKITIPKKVKQIGWYAFFDCENLKEITIHNKNTTIEDYAFGYIDDIYGDLEPAHVKGCKIYGYKNSTAEKYAKANGITFKSIVSVTLSSTSYTYNGKVKKPSVTVKDAKGKKISSKYYTVSYSKGRKNVGQYTVTIKFKGNYSGTVKKTFTIKPKSTTLSKVTAGKKAFTVKWKKQATQTTGYQIQYSTSSKFKGAKTVTVSKNKTTSKKISKLKAKKKYYVRVRTYKTVKVNGKNTKIYSGWSKAKTVKTK